MSERMLNIQFRTHEGLGHHVAPWLRGANVPGDYVGAFDGELLLGSCRIWIGSFPPILFADLLVVYGLDESEAVAAFGVDSNDPRFVIPSLTIQAVIVQPEYRRRGIATRILQAAIAHGKSLGLNRILIDVEPGNLAAQRLYAKSGFESYDCFWPSKMRSPDLWRLVRWISRRPAVLRKELHLDA